MLKKYTQLKPKKSGKQPQKKKKKKKEAKLEPISNIINMVKVCLIRGGRKVGRQKRF